MKCQGCPIASGACVAESPAWAFACRFKDGSAAERAFLVVRSAAAVGPEWIAPAPAPASGPVETPPPWTSEAPRRPLAETMRLLEAVRACPHRSEDVPCGCGGMAACALGKGRGDGLVAQIECIECVEDARE